MLGFHDDIGWLMSNDCEDDRDVEALCISQAASAIRRELFSECEDTHKLLTAESQEESVPRLLLALVKMINEGPNIKHQSAKATSQAALSIAQLIKFNSIKHKRYGVSGPTKHNRCTETPLPLYIGAMIHAKTRKRDLVDRMFDLGLSVSYDRVLRLSAGMANAVCKRYRETEVVCPPQLRGGVFTTAAVDNIDHNPASTTATSSLHGTGISLIQHPNELGEGTDMGQLVITDEVSAKCITPLPEFYMCVPPVSINISQAVVPPPTSTSMQCDGQIVKIAREKEDEWLKTVSSQLGNSNDQQEISTSDSQVTSEVGVETIMENEDRDSPLTISWSAFHANSTDLIIKPKCKSMLLPLFPDSAHSVAMIHHSMKIVQKALTYLNPLQTPVLVFNQPLFALAKEIQWSCPDSVGEEQIVVMLDGLHTEMAALKALGSWLDGSGWVHALVLAEVTTSGKADSLLQASHVTRTRYAHQVTVATLYHLQCDAYQKYCQGVTMNEAMSFPNWCKHRMSESPQFQYWTLTMDFELPVMLLVRSFRESNFKLYTEVLVELIPWLFALDRTHYSRWLPVHIRDMLELEVKHPDVHQEFNNGNFTVQKTSNAFSAISIDQAHEQNNELVKGDGGTIGLTENPSALLRWMVAGPEIARMIQEFEECNEIDRSRSSKSTHHEQSPARQTRFKMDVSSLVRTIDDLGNPFEEESRELLSLSTKDIADESVCHTVRHIKTIGQDQYQAFVEERLVTRSKTLQDKMSMNKLPLFSHRPLKKVPKDKIKLLSAKNDCKLFSKLYIGCQNREGNLEEFFAHENQGCPPSLSDEGKLRSGTKSDLVTCLDKLIDSVEQSPHPTAVIMDGAVLVQMLKPLACRTFLEYSENIFLPYLSKWLEKVYRIDLVWDDYLETSLKASTRSRRGEGTRRRVLPSVSVPTNWQNFLRSEDNKKELFRFLSEETRKVEVDGKMIVATYGCDILSFPAREDKSRLAPCSHEEADSRMMVHVADALAMGHESIMIRNVDIDVVVLACSVVHALNLKELWIAYGTGKNYRVLSAHAYANALGAARSKALPAFHAFSGCDTTSYFCGRGKKTAWATWESFPSATEAFLEMAESPTDVSPECLATLERFVSLLYDRTTALGKVNEVRKYLFTKKGRSIEGLPPTQSALHQHVYRWHASAKMDNPVRGCSSLL